MSKVKEQHWQVYFYDTKLQTQLSKGFDLLIENGVPNHQAFCNAVRQHFNITSDFYFQDRFTNALEPENISASYSNTNAILQIQLFEEPKRTYKLKISNIPDPKLKEHNAKIRYNNRSALCEFLDNSIQYTLNYKKRVIKTTITSDNGGKVIVKDNGLGMNTKEILRFSKLSARGYKERAGESSYVTDEIGKPEVKSYDKETKDFILQKIPELVSSFLSKWGTGAKFAMERLGKDQIVTSTKENAAEKLTVTFKEDWESELTIETSEIDKEIEDHYTKIEITGLHPNALEWARLETPNINLDCDFSSQVDPGSNEVYITCKLDKELAHIYYFYTNGLKSFLDKVIAIWKNHDQCKKELDLENSPLTNKYKIFSQVKLKLNDLPIKIDEKFDYYFENSASIFPFYFKFSLIDVDVNTVANSEGKAFEAISIGFIFYFPFKDGKETYPTKLSPAKAEYYWLGRLLPEEDMIPYFMTTESNKNIKDKDYLHRSKAIILLNRAFTPTPEKNRIQGKSDKIQFEHCSKDVKLHASYQKWLVNCHESFDKELVYSNEISSKVGLNGIDKIYYFSELETMDKQKLKTGNFVKLTHKTKANENVYGNIIHFEYTTTSQETRKNQKITINKTSCDVFFKAESYEIENYDILLQNDHVKPQILKELAESTKPVAIYVSQKKGNKKKVNLFDKLSLRVKTSDEIQCYVYLCNKLNEIISPNDFKIEWWVEKSSPDNLNNNTTSSSNQIILPRGEISETKPKNSKFFTINFNPRFSSGIYFLKIRATIPSEKLLYDYKFPIETFISINVLASAPREIVCTDIYPISLGKKFIHPKIMLKDMEGIPFDWKYLIERTKKVPIITISGRNKNKFLFKDENNRSYDYDNEFNLLIKDFGIILKYDELLSENECISLTYSFDTIQKEVNIPIFPGDIVQCTIDGRDVIENYSMINLNFNPLDHWFNKSLDFQKYSLQFDSSGRMQNILFPNPTLNNYLVHSNLFTFYSNKKSLSSANPRKIEVYKPFIYDSDKKRRIYSSFSIDGVFYQSGDYFKAKDRVMDVISSFGMILFAFIKDSELNEDEDEEDYNSYQGSLYNENDQNKKIEFEYLFLYHPYFNPQTSSSSSQSNTTTQSGNPNVDKKFVHLFLDKDHQWHKNELCLSDYICTAEISKRINHKVYILSENQYNMYGEKYSDQSVYFTKKFFSYSQANLDRPFFWFSLYDGLLTSFEHNDLSKDKSLLFVYLCGEEKIEIIRSFDLSNRDDMDETIIQYYNRSIIGKYFHISFIQWVFNGKLINHPKQIDFPSISGKNNFLFCLPKRSVIDDDSNYSISFKILPPQLDSSFTTNKSTLNNSNNNLTTTTTSDNLLHELALSDYKIQKNYFYISCLRLSVSPTKLKASKIEIHVIDNTNVEFNNKINTIKGICSSPFIMLFKITDDFNNDLTNKIQEIQIRNSNGIIKSLYLLTEKSEMELIIPSSCGEDYWEVYIPKERISRPITIKSLIGTPDSLGIRSIKNSMNNDDKIIFSKNKRIPMKCGNEYAIQFDVLDQKAHVFDISDWKYFQVDKYLLEIFIAGEKPIKQKLEQKTSSNQLPNCFFKIIGTAGEASFRIIAKISSSNKNENFEIKSPLIDCIILPGLPSIINAEPISKTVKTNDILHIKAWLEDDGGNRIHDKSIDLQITNCTWTKSNKDIKLNLSNEGYYFGESKITSTQALEHSLFIVQKISGRRTRHTIDIKEKVLQFTSETAENIAFDIRFENIPPKIKAGERISSSAGSNNNVNIFASTEDGYPLHSIRVQITLLYNKKQIPKSISDQLTDAGEYIIRAEIDKDYTELKETSLIREKKIIVIPNDPKFIQTSPIIETPCILKSNNEKQWIWNGKMKFMICDNFSNICENISAGKYLDFLVSKQDNNTILYNDQLAIQKGCVDIKDYKFKKLSFETLTNYIFCVSFKNTPRSQEISFSIDFTTEENPEFLFAERNKLQNKLDEAKNKLDITVSRSTKLYSDNNANFKKIRKQELEDELEEIEKSNSHHRSLTNNYNPTKFRVHYDKIIEMKVYKEFRECFHGTISSLGYIGQLDASIWDDDKINSLNSELTKWIGYKTMSKVVIFNDKNPSGTEEIISKIKYELPRNTSIPLQLLKNFKNNSNSYSQTTDQQHIILNSNNLLIGVNGFLGFAVNLIYLDANQLEKHIRSRLWHPILGSVMVFDTTDNLARYCSSARDRDSILAFTLDGYHRRGSSITLESNDFNQNNKICGFAPPPESSRRDNIKSELQNLNTYFVKRNETLNVISELENEVEKYQNLIERITSKLPDGVTKSIKTPSGATKRKRIAEGGPAKRRKFVD